MELIKDADVVLCLGTRLNPFSTRPGYGMEYWPKDAKIIQVDADHKMLGLVKKISVGICGDAGAAAKALTARLRDRNLACDATRDARGAEVQQEKQAWEKELDEWTHEKDSFSLDMIAEQEAEPGNYLHPRQVLRELEKAMPTDVMVSTDIGNINSVANSYLRFERPQSFFAPMQFGNCGYAFPTAMGAKVARPERPAIAYVGDGAWGMSLGETMTCVREGIPVVAVVFNNGQWGAEKKNQIDFYADRFLGTNLVNPSFAEFATSCGGTGIAVRDVDALQPALERALAEPGPALVEVFTDSMLI